MPLAKSPCSTKPGQNHFASQIIFYQIFECLFNTQRQNFLQVKTLLKAMYRLICYKRQCKVNRDLCVVYNKQLIKFGLGAFRTLFLSVYFFLSFYYIDNGTPTFTKNKTKHCNSERTHLAISSVLLFHSSSLVLLRNAIGFFATP